MSITYDVATDEVSYNLVTFEDFKRYMDLPCGVTLREYCDIVREYDEKEADIGLLDSEKADLENIKKMFDDALQEALEDAYIACQNHAYCD